MKEETDMMDFLLPDLIGKPDGLTDKEGNIIFQKEFSIPKNCYVFFIPVDMWLRVVK